MTYVLVRERIGRDIVWVLLCASLVLLVGLSRIYLDEHFLSDVLNGYLVGVLWAIIGIFAAEHRGRGGRAAAGTSPAKPRLRWLRAGIAAVSAVALWFIVVHYAQTVRQVVPRAEVQLATSVEQALRDGVLPARTESIIGTPEEPVGIVLSLPDDAALLDIMAAAGWQVLDPPSFRTLPRVAVAAWLGRRYDTAPITPVFWNGWPQDFGFVRSVPAEGLRQRHHARFWRVPDRDARGQQVYVGTASFDAGIMWGLTHLIAPDVDAERDLLTADLLRTEWVRQDGWADLVTPLLGQNVVGDPVFTDGRAAVLSAP